MKKIASFSVNHDKLKKGMYVSRIDGDVVTYDLRMKVPNAGDYLSRSSIFSPRMRATPRCPIPSSTLAPWAAARASISSCATT